MSKVAATISQKLAQLRVIPPNLLPSTLKHKTVLSKVTEIKLEYNRSAKEFGPIFRFYRKYIADLRYHNPNLKIIRQASANGPLIAKLVITKSQLSEPIVLEGAKFRTEDDLRVKLLEINNSQ